MRRVIIGARNCIKDIIWVFSPGETNPGRECLLHGRQLFPDEYVNYAYTVCELCILDNCVMITRFKCQLSGDVLHLCECDILCM